MLDRASSLIRKLAVECRSQALLGNPTQALTRIDDTLQEVGTDSLLDRLVLLMAKVEILYLDCRDEEALQVYTDELDPSLEDLPEEVAIAVSFNRNDVARAIFQPDDFYATLDHSRIADVDLWDYRAFYAGREAAAAGKHYEALPVVWGGLAQGTQAGVLATISGSLTPDGIGMPTTWLASEGGLLRRRRQRQRHRSADRTVVVDERQGGQFGDFRQRPSRLRKPQEALRHRLPHHIGNARCHPRRASRSCYSVAPGKSLNCSRVH